MSWLDQFLTAIGLVQNDGTPLIQRPAINFVLPAGGSVVDDPTTKVTTVTIPTAAASTQISVKVAATSSITLSGTQTIDGVSVGVGDRVLTTGQTSAPENGLWVVASGVWSRTSDALVSGMSIFAQLGNDNRGIWVLLTPDPIVPGTTPLQIVRAQLEARPDQFGGAPGAGIDNSTAIQDAINVVAPLGGIVLFSAGDWEFATRLDVAPGVTLQGQGPTASILKSTSTSDYGIRLYASTATLGAPGNHLGSLQNLQIQTVSGATKAAVKIDGTTLGGRPRLRHVYFLFCAAGAVELVGTIVDILFEDCYAVGCCQASTNPVFALLAPNSTTVRFANCYLSNNRNDSTGIGINSELLDTLVLERTTIESSGNAVRALINGVTALGCYFEAFKGVCIELRQFDLITWGGQLTVHGCTFEKSVGTDGTVFFLNGGLGASIVGNRFSGFNDNDVVLVNVSAPDNALYIGQNDFDLCTDHFVRQLQTITDHERLWEAPWTNLAIDSSMTLGIDYASVTSGSGGTHSRDTSHTFGDAPASQAITWGPGDTAVFELSNTNHAVTQFDDNDFVISFVAWCSSGGPYNGSFQINGAASVMQARIKINSTPRRYTYRVTMPFGGCPATGTNGIFFNPPSQALGSSVTVNLSNYQIEKVAKGGPWWVPHPYTQTATVSRTSSANEVDTAGGTLLLGPVGASSVVVGNQNIPVHVTGSTVLIQTQSSLTLDPGGVIVDFGTSGSGAGELRVVHGRDAKASSNGDGGSIGFSGGAKDGSGTDGRVQLFCNDAPNYGVEAGSLGARYWVNLLFQAPLSATQAPTGSGFVFLGPVATAPSTAPVGGAQIWLDAAAGLNQLAPSAYLHSVVPQSDASAGGTPQNLKAVKTTATSDATPTFGAFLTVPDGAVARVTMHAVAKSGANVAGFTSVALYKRISGTLTMLGSSTDTPVGTPSAALATASATLSLASPNVNALLTGVVATAITWSSWIEVEVLIAS